MKLVAAKCPSCGAGIDVDENSDSTVCEFCHSKIIVNDAIAKMKIELSGSVEIANLPKIENLLILANRHYKNYEVIEGEKEFAKVLELNPNIPEAILKKGVCNCATNDDIYSFIDGVKDAFEVISAEGDKNNQREMLLIETMQKVRSFTTIYTDDLSEDEDFSKFKKRIDGLVEITLYVLDNLELNEERKKHVLNTLVSLYYSLCLPQIDMNNYYYEQWEKYSNELEKIDNEYAKKMTNARALEEDNKENLRKKEEEELIAFNKSEAAADLKYRGRFRWWVVLLILLFISTLGGLVDNCVNCTIPTIILLVLCVLSIPYILIRICRGKLFFGYIAIILIYIGSILLAFQLDIPFLHEDYIYNNDIINLNGNRVSVYIDKEKTSNSYDLTYEKIDENNYYVYFNNQTYKVTYIDGNKMFTNLCLYAEDKCKITYDQITEN